MPSRIATTLMFAAVAMGTCQDAACDSDGQSAIDTVTLLQAPGIAEDVIKTQGDANDQDTETTGVDSTGQKAGQTAYERERAAYIRMVDEERAKYLPGKNTQESSLQTPAKSSIKVSAVFAEYLAMTLFVVIGCGSAMGSANEPGWVLQVALSFGLAITALAYAIGHYSGGQINCAVTFALVLTGHVTVLQGLANFVAQLLGAITGALILTAMFPEGKDKTGCLGTNVLGPGLGRFNAFVGEFMMTFLLVFVVFETGINPETKASREMAALAIGFAVFLAHSVLIPIDGCSINPTRSLGPALVQRYCYNKAGSLQDMPIFWAGPLLGAAAAAAVSGKMGL